MQLDASQLLASAKHSIDVESSSHAAWEEGFSRLVNSQRDDAKLHTIGASRMAKKLRRQAMNRIRIEKVIQQSPSILNRTLPPVVVISGMARTGTTKLHQLLASSGLFNTVPLWRLLNPSADQLDDTNKTYRFQQYATAWSNTLHRASPPLVQAHPFSSKLANEDTFLLELSFQSAATSCWSNPSGFLDWSAGLDFEDEAGWLKTCLQFFHWQDWPNENKPWLLKSPFYFGRERALRKVFGQVTFLNTQRDIDEATQSLQHLLTLFRKPYTHEQASRNQLSAEMRIARNRHTQWRKELTPENTDPCVFDISFESLQRKPLTVAQKALDELELQMTEKNYKQMSDWCDANPNPQSLTQVTATQ